MIIRCSTRPRGLKRGTRTEAFYKAIGYKATYGPDIRDVVGTLTLSACRSSETLFLAALARVLAGDNAGSIVIIEEDGKESGRWESKPDSDSSAESIMQDYLAEADMPGGFD